MKYDIDKTADYLKNSLKSYDKASVLYKALNVGGIQYTSLYDNSIKKNISWSERSSASEFVAFWATVLGETAIRYTGSHLQPKVYKGDIIIKRNIHNDSVLSLNYVLSISNKTQDIELAVINGTSNRITKLNARQISREYSLLPFSKIVCNLSAFYNLLFNKFFYINSMMLFTQLFYSCLPESVNKDGTSRKNSSYSLFSSSDDKAQEMCSDLQEAIEEAIRNRSAISETKEITRTFVKNIFLKQTPTEIESGKTISEEDITKKIAEIQGRTPTIKNFVTETQRKLFRGELLNEKLKSFFMDRDNRKVFQERFTLVMHFYLLLSGIVDCAFSPFDLNQKDCLEWTSDICSSLPLKPDVITELSKTVRYFTNATTDSEISVDSIYALSGYLFDSMLLSDEDDYRSRYEEYCRYQELARCYGVRKLDYYFALERNKSNRYAAIELAGIYFFGMEFEGDRKGFTHKIERNIQESIRLYDSCKDFSCVARWSLGNNYLSLSQGNKEFLNKLTKEAIENEKERLNSAQSFSDEFQDCIDLCKISRDDFINDTTDQLYNRINKNLLSETQKLQDKAEELFLSCDNYPPALNSLGKEKRIKAAELCSSHDSSKDEISKLYHEAIKLLIKAAQCGFASSFNSLYAIFNDAETAQYIDNSYKTAAYKLLTTAKSSNRKTKSQENYDILRRELIQGKPKTLNTLQEERSIIFKFLDPIEQPINFLIVSANLDSLWGANRLGMELFKTGKTENIELAKRLFEYTTQFNPWGDYNLGHYIYSNDVKRKIYYLERARDRGLTEAKEELEALGQTS